MEFTNEKTIRIFDKDMIAELEKIIEANRPKIQEFLGLAVRGRPATNEMLNNVEQSCRANLLGIAFFTLNAIFQAKDSTRHIGFSWRCHLGHTRRVTFFMIQ